MEMTGKDKSSFKKRSMYVIGMEVIVIFLLTFMVYTPALKNDFVNWDDDTYVYENTKIQSLSFKSLSWMLTSFHASNWHPLTWLSHAIDYAFWGLKPLGHHLTNIILHGLNSLLVFLLSLRLMIKGREVSRVPSPSKMMCSTSTQALIVAGITALLFGLHPLHVESVAWVAERKNLLCSFFVLLSILSYLSYTSSLVKRQRRTWFTICFFLFISALMSKPMAVTLPVILLLLDIYPLKRISLSLSKNLSVLLEKTPFFILSIASGIITVIAQHSGGAIKSFEHLPIGFRLLNALNSLVFYLKKMVLPLELIPFYPFPEYTIVLDLRYLISGIIILAVTGYCLWTVGRGKYLFFTAWFYYLITLLPILGIIQVGGQAAADRYTYLPSISIFLLAGLGVVWGWDKISLTGIKTGLRGLLLICSCAVVFLLSYLTINQIKVWKNSEILWSYVISAFPEKIPEAHDNLGIAYESKGMLDEAIFECKKALSLNPNFAKAHNNLGAIYVQRGMLDEAIFECKKALSLNPNFAKAHTNLGNAYGEKGMLDEAIAEYKKALTINPNLAGAHNNLAVDYYSKGNYRLAVIHCDRAIKLGCNVNPKLLELLKPYR